MALHQDVLPIIERLQKAREQVECGIRKIRNLPDGKKMLRRIDMSVDVDDGFRCPLAQATGRSFAFALVDFQIELSCLVDCAFFATSAEWACAINQAWREAIVRFE